MNALIYARVSTAGQAERYSLSTQIDECKTKAQLLGAESIWTLTDTHTGTELDRPSLQTLRDKVASGEVDVIVAFDPDRFSRNLTDLLLITREIDDAGVKLEFVNFDWRNTAQGMLFLQLRGAIAQFEHAQIRERTRRGKLKKAQLGKLRTYASTYGYDFNCDTDELEINDQQAAIVRQMFSWYVEGKSTYDIAWELNDTLIPAPGGTKWWASTIYRILRNETYAGRLRRRDEKPQWKPVLTPSIVTRNLFEQVQSRLSAHRGRKKNSKHDYLLRGLLVCGLCEKKLWGRSTRNGKTVYRYYRCPNVKGRCSLSAVRATDVECAIWEQIRSQLIECGAIESYHNELGREVMAERKRKIDQISAALKRCDSAGNRLQRMHIFGSISESELIDHQAKINEQRRRLNKRLQALNCKTELDEPKPNWLQITFEQKQRIINTLIDRIEVYRDKAVAYGTIGDDLSALLPLSKSEQ